MFENSLGGQFSLVTYDFTTPPLLLLEKDKIFGRNFSLS